MGIAAPEWGLGGVAPDPNFVGIVPTLAFDKLSDDFVHYSLLTPYRLKAGSIITVRVDWCYTGGQDNGTVCWNLEYNNLAIGDAVDGTTTNISKVSAGTHPTGTKVRTVLTTGITGTVARGVIGLKLSRDISEDTLDTDAEMIQVHFEFVMDKLGQAT